MRRPCVLRGRPLREPIRVHSFDFHFNFFLFYSCSPAFRAGAPSGEGNPKFDFFLTLSFFLSLRAALRAGGAARLGESYVSLIYYNVNNNLSLN